MTKLRLIGLKKDNAALSSLCRSSARVDDAPSSTSAASSASVSGARATSGITRRPPARVGDAWTGAAGGGEGGGEGGTPHPSRPRCARNVCDVKRAGLARRNLSCEVFI